MARILDEVIGHEVRIERLLQAVEEENLASTLLFVGPSGIGKRKIALGLVQALVCERTRRACGACGPCVRVEKHQSESLMLVEPEGVAIKIEQAREVQHFVTLQRLGRARVVIFNQAHLLNPQAGNALLKLLEEPPEGTYFILITSNPAALLSTIRSRSQVVRFAPLEIEQVRRITEAEDWVLQSSQGSVEFAQRLQESEWSELRQAALQPLIELVQQGSITRASAVKEAAKDRASAAFIAQCWQKAFRDALLMRSLADGSGRTLEAVLQENGVGLLVNSDEPELIQRLAEMPFEDLDELAQQTLLVERDLLGNVDKGLVFENFLIALRRSYSGQGHESMLDSL